MRVLTLENMHSVRLQRLFDYQSLNAWQRIVVKSVRSLIGQKDVITLADVYNEFAKGKKFHEVMEALRPSTQSIDTNEILSKTILVGEVFYHAVHPGISGFKKSNIVRALCDENIDEHFATHGAMRTFGQASHTTFENLTNKPDSLVWRRANEGEFTVILTKDTATKAGRLDFNTRDLTNCAYDAWREVFSRNGGIIDDEIRDLPILIHIKNADATGKEIRQMLKRHKTEIFNLIQQRKSPVIEIRKGRKPQIGIHYLELIDGGTEKRKKTLINKRVGLFMRDNPFELSREEKKDFLPTIRKLITKDVSELVKEYPNSETRIPMLNSKIKSFDMEPAMTLKHQKDLERGVLNARNHRYRRKSALQPA